MATTEIWNENTAVVESEVRELSDRVAQQVSEILEEAVQLKVVPRPVVSYRVPAAGVRYYF